MQLFFLIQLFSPSSCNMLVYKPGKVNKARGTYKSSPLEPYLSDYLKKAIRRDGSGISWYQE